MHISKKIIEDFFAHQCSSKEAELVRVYLSKHPEEIEKYLPASEWNDTGLQTLFPHDFWDKQWRAIEARRKKRSISILIRRMSVAAAVLLLIGASAYYFTQKPAVKQEYVAKVTPQFKTITNTKTTVQQITTTDGSFIELQPGATITFKEGFEKNSRDIVLNGEAVFSVAKDKDRPFTVYSGNISTTALGTKFKVVHWSNGAKTKVLLYNGKVVVKVANTKNKTETFLLPGDVLSYSENIVNVARSNNTDASKIDSKPENIPDANAQPLVERKDTKDVKKRTGTVVIPNWYKFEKESVANVFDQLALLYNVKIEYNAEVLKQKYFIGKFDKQNSIEKILKTIAELNQLKVEKANDSHFIIK